MIEYDSTKGSAMDIKVYPDTTGIAPNWARFHAIDYDTYDGAPDGNRTIGMGATEDEAVRDLLEQLNDTDDTVQGS